MKQKVKTALDKMLKKLKNLNLESAAARFKIIDDIEIILNKHNEEQREIKSEMLDSMLKDKYT